MHDKAKLDEVILNLHDVNRKLFDIVIQLQKVTDDLEKES